MACALLIRPRQVPVLALVGLVLLLNAPYALEAAKLPGNLKRCARVDPGFSECLRNAIQDALPKLKDGIPKLGFPPFDPVRIENISVQQGSQNLNLKYAFLNATLVGLSSGTVTRAEVDFEQRRAHIEYFMPLAELEGIYEVDGRFLIVPVKGRGKVSMKYWNPSMVQDLEGEVVKKADGKDYWKFTKSSINVTLGEKNYIKYENAENSDARIAEAINKLVNENVKAITEEVMPLISETMGEIFKRYTAFIFDKVPIEEIFPLTL